MSYKLLDSEQFRSMQATVETVRFDDGMTVKRLVSYDSVVCDVDLNTGTVFFYPRFQYSPATVRQLIRFLNEYVPVGGYWYISKIRDAQKRVDIDGYTGLGGYGVFFPASVLGTNNRW